MHGNMTKLDFLCLLPLLIVASAPVIIMLTITVSRNLKIIYGFSLFMFAAAFISLFFIVPDIPHRIDPLLVIDNFSLVFLGALLCICILITVISYVYLTQHGGQREEYFVLLFVATLGASVLVTASHFVTFFIGLETLSICEISRYCIFIHFLPVVRDGPGICSHRYHELQQSDQLFYET